MSLQGLPDFSQRILGNGYQIFYPYDNAGDYIILPDLLEISDRPDDSLDFRLNLVRTEHPNLPARRPGVIAMGVTLRAAPYLPDRPQAAIATTELTPPEDQERLLLRLLAREPPQYTVMTFVVISTSQGAKQFKSDEMPHSGDTLHLNIDDFPVTFLPIEAWRSLLEIAAIRGVCRCFDQEILMEQSFVLNLEQPAIALSSRLSLSASC